MKKASIILCALFLFGCSQPSIPNTGSVDQTWFQADEMTIRNNQSGIVCVRLYSSRGVAIDCDFPSSPTDFDVCMYGCHLRDRPVGGETCTMRCLEYSGSPKHK